MYEEKNVISIKTMMRWEMEFKFKFSHDTSNKKSCSFVMQRLSNLEKMN